MPGIELHWLNASEYGPLKYISRWTDDHQVVAIESGKEKTISRSSSALQSMIVNELSGTIFFPSAKVVSRQHARLFWYLGGPMIEDHGSTHGTYIAHRDARLSADGYWIEHNPSAELVRVFDPACLQPGDYVQLGKECGSGDSEYHPVRLYVCSWDDSREAYKDHKVHPTIGISEVDDMSDYDRYSDDHFEGTSLASEPLEARSSTPSESISFDSRSDPGEETKGGDSFVTEVSSFADTSLSEDSLHPEVEHGLATKQIEPAHQPSEAEPNKTALETIETMSCDAVMVAQVNEVSGITSEPRLTEEAPISKSTADEDVTPSAGINVTRDSGLSVHFDAALQGTKRSAEESVGSGSESESCIFSPSTSCASTSTSSRPIKRLRSSHSAGHSHNHSGRKAGSLRTAAKILRGVVYTASLFSIGFLSGSVFTFKAVMNTAAQISAPPGSIP